MNDDQSSAQLVSYRDTKGRFTEGWKGGGRKLGSRQMIAEEFLADFHAVWQQHGLDALRETALAEPAKFCAIAAHLIRNEQIDVRSGDGFRDCLPAKTQRRSSPSGSEGSDPGTPPQRFGALHPDLTV